MKKMECGLFSQSAFASTKKNKTIKQKFNNYTLWKETCESERACKPLFTGYKIVSLMKAIKFVSTIATVFFTILATFWQPQTCQAQYYEITLDEKVENSELIVEGEVIESESYEKDGKIYTCHKLSVANWVYPLNSPCNTLDFEGNCFYVLTTGGRLEDKSEIWSHSLKLYRGAIGLFFLSPTSKPTLYTDAPSYEVYSGYQGFIRYDMDEKGNFLGNEIFNQHQNPESDLIQPIYSLLNISATKPSFIRDDWGLDFLIDNIQVANDEVTFDVNLKSKWGNPFKIKQLLTRLRYDPSVFGNNILTSGNLTVSLDAGLAQYGVSITTGQDSVNLVSIGFSDNNLTDGSFIGTDYQKLMTVELQLQIGSLTSLPYFEFSMTPSNQLLSNSGSEIVNPSETKVRIKPGGLDFCLLGGIDDVLPHDVAAGVRANMSSVFDADSYSGIITITGCGFGDLPEPNLADHIPNDFRVEFDAEGIGAGANVKVTPFARDYLQWDDEIIRVLVPGIGYLIQNDVLIPDVILGSTASSGDIRVIVPGMMPLVREDAITVHFAHINDYRGADNMVDPDHKSVRIRLKALDDYFDEINNNLPHENDGVEVFFTPAFLDDDNMPDGSDDAVGDAMNEWRCRTRVNFQIVDQADIEVPDFAGTIDYGDLAAGIVADSWEVVRNGLTQCEATDPVDDTPVTRFGIVFSNAFDFFVDGGVPDVNSVALHEIGHNIILGHVDLVDYTMHRVVIDIDHDLSGGDVSGGQHLVIVSGTDITCTVGGNDIPFPGMVLLGPCPNATKEEELEVTKVAIYPNPSSSFIKVKSSDEFMDEVRLFNSMGELIFTHKLDNPSKEVELNYQTVSGTYFVVVRFKNGNFSTQKIILSK